MFGISLIALAVNFICVEDAAFRFLGLNYLFCLSWDYRHSCLQKQLAEARGNKRRQWDTSVTKEDRDGNWGKGHRSAKQEEKVWRRATEGGGEQRQG